MEFKLEKNKKKGKCPQCGANNTFRFFEGFHGDFSYGRCDRENSCGFYRLPDMKDHPDYVPPKRKAEPEKTILYLDDKACSKLIEDQSSNFHTFCIGLGISKEHLKKWMVGSENGKTVFFFKTFDGKFVNRKTGNYGTDGKRIKRQAGVDDFYSLQQPTDGKGKYVLCLYGEHQLLGQRPVVIVESEKTAIIASFFYPELNWVACGSASGLSDGTGGTNNRINAILGREVWWLCDADKAGRDNSSISNIRKWFTKYKIIDLFKDHLDDGWDIADDIIAGKRPVIYPDKVNLIEFIPQSFERPVNTIYFPEKTEARLMKGDKIGTLHLVVGERQANLADHYGLMVAAIDNLQGFTQKKSGDQVHKLIEKFILKEQIDKVVLLGDADTLKIEYNEKDPEKDLAERLRYYQRAVEKLKKVAVKCEAVDFYFLHVRKEFSETVNSIDELFEYLPDEHEQIIADVQKLNKSEKFFQGFNVEALTVSKICSYFWFEFKNGVPEAFYSEHEEQLGTNEWVFDGHKWKFQSPYGLVMTKHRDSFSFARIGCTYIKQIQVPNSKGVLERKLVPWNKSEIIQDYVKEKSISNFINMIPKYDSFCNVPSNNGSFQQVVQNCYNMYYKMNYEPEQGEWPTIKMYLEHLFKNQYQDKMDLMLDYLKLLYQHPTQKLPIIVLASREKETGKSTFIWFLIDIFGENATVLGNEELTDKFNDDYASKLIAGIEEGFIERRLILEKLKTWATADYIPLNTKFQSRQKISFFCKFIITTNDEKEFIRIDSDETRFIVCKIPRIQKLDPDLRDKMKEEIPAFLKFLEQREFVHTKKTRHWFSVEEMNTDALMALKNSSRRFASKALEKFIKETFFEFEISEFKMQLQHIRDRINAKHSFRQISSDDIQKELEEELCLKPSPETIRYSIPEWNIEDGLPRLEWRNFYYDKVENKKRPYIGRPYTFYISDFIKRGWIKPEDVSETFLQKMIVNHKIMEEDMIEEQRKIDGPGF